MYEKSKFLQFSQAADNNLEVITEVLRDCFSKAGTVLELGSGTGQHAVGISSTLPHLRWQPSEHKDNIESLRENLKAFPLANVNTAVALTIGETDEQDTTANINTVRVQR